MKKRFKTKKKFKLGKLILSFSILILSLFIIKTYLLTITLANTNSEFIKHILDDNNYYSYYKESNIMAKVKNYIYDKFKPNNILNNSIEKEKTNNLVLVSNNKEKKNNGIYLYNSHQKEEYDSKYLSEYNIIPNVLMASFMLEEKVEKRGINCVVEDTDMNAYMKKNGMNHAESYIASRKFLEEFYKNNNDMDLYIDIHRDAISHNLSVVEIDGKMCAKVLFVIGLENENYSKNLSVVEKINAIINKKYPNLSRGIMKKKGPYVNGVYNQDINFNVILLELGGNENTIEEVNNTLDLIANVLEEYINGSESL